MTTHPHQMPASTLFASEELIAWVCAACGEMISEFDPCRSDCPVDWRAQSRHPSARPVESDR